MTPETAELGLSKLDAAIYELTNEPNIIKPAKVGELNFNEYCEINKIDPYLQTK